MKAQYHDVLVLKEYETYSNGVVTKHKSWNKVGRAWRSRSEKALNLELFLIPGQKYVVSLRDEQTSARVAESTQANAANDTFESFDDISL